MKTSVLGPTSAGKAGWVVIVLVLAWVAFLFVPRPKAPPPAKDAGSLPPLAAQSKLEELGLENNPDWTGLPRFFAVWQDQLSWEHGRARFAFWNPGSGNYGYYFEATRAADGSVGFRSIRRADFLATLRTKGIAGEPDLETTSDTDPFVFAEAPSTVRVISSQSKAGVKFITPAPAKVDVKIDADPLKPPPVTVKSDSHG